MSAILETIIARGFNLNQPNFGNAFVDAKNKRQVIDSNLQNDEAYRRNSDFQLQQIMNQVAQQERAGQSLSELVALEGEMPEVMAAQERALANSNNLENIRPELRPQAEQMLMKPVNERAAKAQALKAEYLRNSPAAQGLVAEQMFAAPILAEEQGPMSELGKLAHDMDMLRQQNPNDPRLEYFDKKMAAAGLTGGAEGGMPADVQTAMWYSSATPEQRANFDRTKRAASQFGVYMDGGAESVAGFARTTNAAATEGTENAKARGALGSAIPVMETAYNGLSELRDAIADAPDTGRVRQYLVANDAKLQELEQMLNSELLTSIATAKGMGVTFGALSEGEITTMLSTIANMRNKKEANLAIVDRQLSKIGRQLEQSRWAYQNWATGAADPRISQPMPQAEPAAPQGGDTDIDPIVERNLR